MGRWRGFLDSLSTTGGHIFMLSVLIGYGAILAILGEVYKWVGVGKIGENMIAAAMGALLMLYKTSGTNAEQIARAGAPYQPPQPPPDALKPPIVVAAEPLPPSKEGESN